MGLLNSLIIFFLINSACAFAGVTNFTPTDDGIRANNPTVNYSANTSFQATSSTDSYLAHFNLASINGQNLTYAHLYFWFNRSSNHTMTIYRILQNLNTSQSTYNIYSTGNNWNTAGANGSGTDYTPTDAVTITNLPEGAYQEVDITPLVTDCMNAGTICNLKLTMQSLDIIDTSNNATTPPYLTIATGTPGTPNLWYVRDGGGTFGNTSSHCNGTANVVFTGSNGPNCAVNHPNIIAGIGNAVQWTGGDIMYIDGDSDTSYAFTVSGVTTGPLVGDEYTNNGITYTVTVPLPTGQTSGIISMSGSGAPTSTGNLTVVAGHGSGTSPIAFSAEGPAQAMYVITSQIGIPEGASSSQPTSMIGTGSQKPQLWSNQYEGTMIGAQTSYVLLQNLDLTQHNNCISNGPLGPSGQSTGTPYNPDGSPYVCTNNSVPGFGNTGVLIGGTGLSITNVNVHGLNNGMNNPISGGIVGNVTFTNVKIFGNASEGLSIGQGQPTDNVMTGTMSFIDSQIDFNGCGQRYPLQDSTDINNNIAAVGFSHSEDDEANYYNCFGQATGGYGDGVAFGPNGNANAGNWSEINSSISFNTQDGLDTLHGNGNGTVSVIRSRNEGNAGQQIKLNGLIEDVENSIINGDCARWIGAPESSSTKGYLDPSGPTGFIMGDVCRANGDVDAMLLTANTKVYFYNNTISANGIAILTGGSNCNSATNLNVYNNIINGGAYASQDPTIGGSNNAQLITYIYNSGSDGNGTGTCGNVGNGSGGLITPNENYNIIYNTKNNNQGCLGVNDLCGTLPGFNSTIPMGTINGGIGTYYQGTAMLSLENLAVSSAARGAGNSTGLVYTNGTNDFNNFARTIPTVDMGGLAYGSYPVYCTGNGGTCTLNGGCCSGFCNSNTCVAYICGDGLVTSPEVCDTSGPNLNSQTCITQGFSGGTLGCTAGCLSFNTSSCTGSCTALGGSCSTGSTCCSGLCSGSLCVAQICGDGVIPEGNKVCDGANLNNQTCLTQGYASGTLACAINCLSFNTSGCVNNTANISIGMIGSINGN